MPGSFWNDWTGLEIIGNCLNGCELVTIAGIGWTYLDMARMGWNARQRLDIT